MDSLKHKARLAQKFSLLDWLALIESWWRLFFFHFALLATSFNRLKDSTRARDQPAPNESSALSHAEHIHRLVGYAARLHLIPMTCLDRALTLQKMLSDRNIPAQIKIGAQKIQGTMYAHAWVEINGKPIGETDDIAEKFNVLEPAAKIHNRKFI